MAEGSPLERMKALKEEAGKRKQEEAEKAEAEKNAEAENRARESAELDANLEEGQTRLETKTGELAEAEGMMTDDLPEETRGEMATILKEIQGEVATIQAELSDLQARRAALEGGTTEAPVAEAPVAEETTQQEEGAVASEVEGEESEATEKNLLKGLHYFSELGDREFKSWPEARTELDRLRSEQYNQEYRAALDAIDESPDIPNALKEAMRKYSKISTSLPSKNFGSTPPDFTLLGVLGEAGLFDMQPPKNAVEKARQASGGRSPTLDEVRKLNDAGDRWLANVPIWKDVLEPIYAERDQAGKKIAQEYDQAVDILKKNLL